MRLLLVTVGTRGDVEPFIALAGAAAAAGHDVALCSIDDYAALIQRSTNFMSIGELSPGPLQEMTLKLAEIVPAPVTPTQL